MLELPEVITIAKQLEKATIGKKVERVLPPNKAHKFCWYEGDPADYVAIEGHKVTKVEGFGFYVEMTFDNGARLCINDGVNVRVTSEKELPKAYQLAICFSDGSALSYTVAMYGGIMLFPGETDSPYYVKSRESVSPLGEGFDEVYWNLVNASKPTLSAKAFLATEQRFPGIGNGVLQDILLAAHIHPKRKLKSLTDGEKSALLESIKLVLADMTEKGGRDTEKDIYGNNGGYETKLSRNTLLRGCPVCFSEIKKEAYMGGSIYYCTRCQPLE